MAASETELRRCILGGTSLLVGLLTAVVALCVYVPTLDAVTGTPEFRGAALASSLAAVLLILSMTLVRSHAYQRLVLLVVGICMAALLVVAAHRVSSKGVVMTTLVAAAILTGLAAYAGSRAQDVSALGPFLLIGLVVLCVAGLLNGLVFHAHWLETVCSTLAVALFTAFSVYDANRFVKLRICRFDCCEEGVFSLYQNFANVAINLMGLNSERT